MRDICKVIDKMLEIIPNNQDKLISDFNEIKRAAPYTAPELMKQMWAIGMRSLHKAIGFKPNEDWHWEILSIWMVKPVPELKEMFP